MKLSLAIAPEDALPTAFVVFRDRLEVSIAKAARLGYDAVELALSNADQVDPRRIRGLLDDHRLGISAVSTGRVFAEEKVWLTSPNPAVRRRAVELLQGLVQVAVPLGARLVNIGRVRGFVAETDTRAAAEERFMDGIRAVAGLAAPLGISIVIEPVNRYEINFINSVAEAVALVARSGCANLGVMPDVFHMNIEDASIPGSLEAAGSRVGYVHFADSNRWAPGQGHLDFPAILGALRRIHYTGYIGIEILPYPTADIAARQAVEFLRPLNPQESFDA